jgi:hypothetical protein
MFVTPIRELSFIGQKISGMSGGKNMRKSIISHNKQVETMAVTTMETPNPNEQTSCNIPNKSLHGTFFKSLSKTYIYEGN